MSDVQVRLDLNSPVFLRGWFALDKNEAHAVFLTLRKLSSLTWNQLYRDTGLKWEAVNSREGPGGGNIYSIRISGKCRAIVRRLGDAIQFLSLHPDHDSAYN